MTRFEKLVLKALVELLWFAHQWYTKYRYDDLESIVTLIHEIKSAAEE